MFMAGVRTSNRHLAHRFDLNVIDSLIRINATSSADVLELMCSQGDASDRAIGYYGQGEIRAVKASPNSEVEREASDDWLYSCFL